MLYTKVVLSIILAVLGPALLFRWRDSKHELGFLRLGIIGATVLKFVLCIVIYTVFRDLRIVSDASIYYLPETLQFLEGKIPYRDFGTSYGLFFHAILAGPVYLWQSVGAIVLTMLVFESLTLWIYLKLDSTYSIGPWRVAFLYAWSPVSIYWIGMTGYNGAILQFLSVLSLYFLKRNWNAMSSLALGSGMLLVKFLSGLMWPSLVLIRRAGSARRLISLSGILLLLVFASIVGLDVFLPLRREFGSETSGNCWYILRSLIPAIEGSRLVHWLAPAMIMVAILTSGLYQLRISRKAGDDVISQGAASYAFATLVFLLLSPKSYTFYHAMAFLFVCHIVAASPRLSVMRIVPLSVLGALSIFETSLWGQVRDGQRPGLGGPSPILLIVDTAIVICHFWLAREAWRQMTTTVGPLTVDPGSFRFGGVQSN